MPDLPSYQRIEDPGPVQDYQEDEQTQTPTGMYLQNVFSHTWNEGFGGSANVYYINHVLNQDKVLDPETNKEITNTWLDANTAKQRYGITIHSDQKITDLAAQKIAELKSQQQEREDIINKAPKDFMTQGLGLATGFVASMLDPLNIGASMVPLIGEARGLTLMKRFGPTVGRMIVGGANGMAMNALAEPFRYENAQTLNYNYNAFDSFLNIAAGGVMGGLLHVGFGKIGDLLGLSHWSEKLNDGTIDPEMHEQALRTAVGQVIQDQRVNISPIIRSMLDQKFQNLQAISAVRLIKSASDSASSFMDHFNQVDFIQQYHDQIRGLLTEAEQPIFDATSTQDIVEGQMKVGQDIQALKEELVKLQSQIEGTSYNIQDQLSREMGKISDELKQKQGLLDNLLSTRKYVDELMDELHSKMSSLEPMKRSELNLADFNPEDNNMQLNIEKYQDENYKELNKLDFKKIKSAVDKALLRKAILKAQDLNQLDQVTPDQILDMATEQSSLKGQWYHDPSISQDIDQNLKDMPSDFNLDEAQKSLDDIMGRITMLNKGELFTDAELESLKSHDDQISMAKKLGEALESAGQCIIGGML